MMETLSQYPGRPGDLLAGLGLHSGLLEVAVASCDPQLAIDVYAARCEFTVSRSVLCRGGAVVRAQ